MKNKTFTVYISGKITGLDLLAAKFRFKTAEIELQQKGWDTINPFNIVVDNDMQGDWKACMLIDIKALMYECDGIYMLNNWRTSRGARIERIIAQELGLFIAYQPK